MPKTKTAKTIQTPEQVAAHFGADFDAAQTAEQNNARLSRRIYKDTECGAWAEVVRQDITHREQQEWTARYTKVESAWQLLSLVRDGDAVEFSVHGGQVREYFFPTGIDMSEFLDGEAKGAADLTLTDTVEIKVKTGEEWVFRCGSIVEGVDAEVMPEEVVLPCVPSDLDRAVKAVEDAAKSLWNETHGCDNCSAENDTGYRSINHACTACHGEGTIL